MRQIIVGLLLGLAACGGDGVDETPIVISTNEPDVGDADTDSTELTGAQLYTLHCETCHGPDGAGGTTWSGSIQGLRTTQIALEGRATMVAVTISEGEAKRIQEFLDSFGVDQSALTGREIFANRCAPCHGNTGEGTESGWPIRFMHPRFTEWLVRNGRTSRDLPGPMPAYSLDEISETQLAAMTAFMWAQPWPGGGEGLYTAMCNNCHGEDGHSGYAGHDVARHPDVVGFIRNGHGGTGYANRTSFMPSWSADMLSDYEVDQINDYVQGL